MDPTAPDVQNAIAETLRPAQRARPRGHPRARPERGEGARGAHAARQLHRQHAVDGREQGQPSSAPERRAARARRAPAGRRPAHEQRQGAARSRPVRRATRRVQLEHLRRAVAEYKLAAIGWEGFLKQDENAPDAYESRYWLADAKHTAGRASRSLLHKLAEGRIPRAVAAGRRRGEGGRRRRTRLGRGRQVPRERGALRRGRVATSVRDIEYQSSTRRRGPRESSTARPSSSTGTTRDPQGRHRSDPAASSRRAWRPAKSTFSAYPPNLDVNHRALEYQWYAAEVFFRTATSTTQGPLRADVQGALRQGRVRLQGVGEAHLDEQLHARRGAVAPARGGREEPLVRRQRGAEGRSR